MIPVKEYFIKFGEGFSCFFFATHYSPIKPVQEIVAHQRNIKKTSLPIGQCVDLIFTAFLQLAKYFNRFMNGTFQHFRPTAIEITDRLLPIGMLFYQFFGGFYNRSAFILLLIPVGCADVFKKMVT